MAEFGRHSPDVYYKAMKEYVLPRKGLYQIGFPVIFNYESVRIDEKSYFGNSNITNQKCRCQKTVSLTDDNWYYATDCRYHPLKATKESSWIYKCCGNRIKSPGCMSSKYHTSFYIPLQGDWFTTKDLQNNFCYDIFSLDCEFVFTEVGMEVARVSLVSFYEGFVYDRFVKPRSKILDYNTQFSGITPIDLKKQNAVTLYEVQYDLTHKFLNQNSILIGHGLHTDLKGLHMCHDNIIDTSLLYPHFKGFPYRYSLEFLAKEHLGISIHSPESGHNSIEDANVCLSLVALKCGFSDYYHII